MHLKNAPVLVQINQGFGRGRLSTNLSLGISFKSGRPQVQICNLKDSVARVNMKPLSV